MIGIGSDHNGFSLKQRLAEHLAGRGYEVQDFGTLLEEPADYPDIAAAVAGAIRAGRIERAVLVCGTGLGMAIAANKVPGVFAAPVTDTYTARRARESNDVQIITLGADIVGPGLACAIAEVWLQAEFAGGASARKVAKVRALEVTGAWNAGTVPVLQLATELVAVGVHRRLQGSSSSDAGSCAAALRQDRARPGGSGHCSPSSAQTLTGRNRRDAIRPPCGGRGASRVVGDEQCSGRVASSPLPRE